MFITSLKMQDFRNLQDTEIKPSMDINVIFGENAQGKTNLIEGIWLFSGNKSFRGARDKELITLGREKSRMEIEFFSEEREQTAEIIIDVKRRATLNGVELKSVSSLSESIHSVVFSPEHLSLIKEGPKNRRNFLNTAILGLYPSYADIFKKYVRAMQQRNSILKDIGRYNSLYMFLEDYENILATLGARIISIRKRYLERLREYIPEIYEGISGGTETLSVEYFSEFGDSREELLKALEGKRQEDIMNRTTSVGPHRDDIVFKINGLNAKNFGSQGQQRSIVLALKMAEAELINAVTGEKPIILLDDVLSELDEKRQNYLLNNIRDRQVFITCCENSIESKMKKGKSFKIANGRIEEKSVDVKSKELCLDVTKPLIE